MRPLAASRPARPADRSRRAFHRASAEARLNAARICASLLAGIFIASWGPPPHADEAKLRVGSKRFTESYILGEIVAQTARGAGGTPTEHQKGLGNTAILLNALESGSIDVYPEYTGTIAREILKLDHVPSLADLRSLLAKKGLDVAVPLGFNNSYALAVRNTDAQAKSLRRLSDLKQHPKLRLGLSQEFIGRADGWPGLVRAYGLKFPPPKGLDHGIAYEAIAGGQVDVIDIYSTDAKLTKYRLVVLADDANYFPRYDAVLLFRADLPARFPRAWQALQELEDQIDDAAMRQLNARAEIDGQDFATVASQWLAQVSTPTAEAPLRQAASEAALRASLWQKLFGPDFSRLAFEHVALVFAALAASCAVGIPLGVYAARRKLAAPWIFGIVGTIQTVPSLALLAFLIPLTGRIGLLPAFIALALYALLPIVRNTQVGFTQIPVSMTEAAQALALPRKVILRRIELPLALPTILAGVKTSAVVNVGTATIAAFIGAGGFGERIVTGLALNDATTLLAGAIPVAALALLVQAGFDLLERRLVPAGLRVAKT